MFSNIFFDLIQITRRRAHIKNAAAIIVKNRFHFLLWRIRGVRWKRDAREFSERPHLLLNTVQGGSHTPRELIHAPIELSINRSTLTGFGS